MRQIFSIDEVELGDIDVVPNVELTPKCIQIIDPEFSSVCPKTGMPDFGRIILRYVPDKQCVELKSWKLYLRDYYGVGCFHETATQLIMDAFVDAVKPVSCRITIDWGARGGLHTTTQLTWKAGEGYILSSDDWDNDVFRKHADNWTNS